MLNTIYIALRLALNIITFVYLIFIIIITIKNIPKTVFIIKVQIITTSIMCILCALKAVLDVILKTEMFMMDTSVLILLILYTAVKFLLLEDAKSKKDDF